jgi:hypothetical protein
VGAYVTFVTVLSIGKAIWLPRLCSMTIPWVSVKRDEKAPTWPCPWCPSFWPNFQPDFWVDIYFKNIVLKRESETVKWCGLLLSFWRCCHPFYWHFCGDMFPRRTVKGRNEQSIPSSVSSRWGVAQHTITFLKLSPRVSLKSSINESIALLAPLSSAAGTTIWWSHVCTNMGKKGQSR